MIEGVPAHVYEEIAKYGKSLKESDMISKDEFLNLLMRKYAS